ncbi:siderophore-interacting protein [Herbihabitans rhizosphaerae]|uniref:Siderophore-interacting protein n=1 Tax=Herbihabitans rhizosphaerae TaxID=1872711 RepID=A0A4Q7KPL0_9PSEU|nr:siderophore-interacting protein [Herbihabitans rhizosphaerae]RZS37631.1 siderophore-interacting protein [Herbihabitans rhizosphaerae]
MARTNIRQTRVKPAVTELLTLRVLRRERLSEHFARVTLGGGDIERFEYMGFDQWFRLFIPVAGERTLDRMPGKLGMIDYMKYLRVAKTDRPVLRNYTVRAYREDGPEIDIDEGIGFNPDPSISEVVLVTDESGLPAIARSWSRRPASR